MIRLKKLIGDPVNRVEARLKVTGAARFAGDIPLNGTLIAYPVVSEIGAGSIRFIDTEKALKVKGVVTVLTHMNAPRLHEPPQQPPFNIFPFSMLAALQDNVINYSGKYIALVVAETFEQARYAASLINVSYDRQKGAYSFHRYFDNAEQAEHLLPAHLEPYILRGDVNEGLSMASEQINEHYSTPYEHHFAMEPHVALAQWTGADSFTFYSSSQQVVLEQQIMAILFGVPVPNVRLIAKFIGGGFGGKSIPWQHVILAIMAARVTAQPVKLIVPRKHLSATVGHRSHIDNHIVLSATSEGRLTFTGHYITAGTDATRAFIEHAGEVTPHLYSTPHLEVQHNAVTLNMPESTIMRAPGSSSGMFALESAMDELAYKLGVDPIALRELNEPESDPQTALPWSSRSLIACMREGAAAFNWHSRATSIKSQRRGNKLYGQGMANAMYPANRQPSSAQVDFDANGNVTVKLAATDLGTGTYTILTQIAAEFFGIPLASVSTDIGDSTFPPAPGSGASVGAASWSNAVYTTCSSLLQKFLDLLDESSSLYGVPIADVVCVNGRIEHKDDATRSEGFVSILTNYNNSASLSATAFTGPPQTSHISYSYGSHFVEVSVDVDTKEVRVERVVSRFACGRILNLKTARSQIEGAVIWGIGMALMEESVVDTRTGKFINNDFAGYHVPVIADIPHIDAAFIEEFDEVINETGVKGLGEVGLNGVAAAIANAVYHATGKRVRNLPITPDKLIET